MVMAIVVAPMAVKEVATCRPTIIANRGMAINASPNPRADLIKVDKKRIARTRSVVVENSITLQQIEWLSDNPVYLTISNLLLNFPITSPEIIFGLQKFIIWYDV